jgi:hypothetical protein
MNIRNRIKLLEKQLQFRFVDSTKESIMDRIDRYAREFEAGTFPSDTSYLERFATAFEDAVRREEYTGESDADLEPLPLPHLHANTTPE